MKKGILTICALALCLSAASCGRRASPSPGPYTPAPPTATSSLSPPSTPAPSAAPTALPAGVPPVTPASSETPVPQATGLGGAIPADQPFSSYSSVAGNYDVQFPDGWEAQTSGESARFTHGWSGMQVDVVHTADPFTLDAIKAGPVADLIRTGRAVTVRNVAAVTAKSGAAILAEYECNSEPQNGKQVRLENQRYYFYMNGTLASLTLWAPAGADNWKIWAQMADTFEWRQS